MQVVYGEASFLPVVSCVQALISVGATGVSVAPQGLNIAPALIAVTPGRVAINPQGGTISPVDLSVSAPAEPAKKPNQPGGRRMLQQNPTEEVRPALSLPTCDVETVLTDWQGLLRKAGLSHT